MSVKTLQAVRGFKDLLGAEAARAARLEAAAREVFARYGFGELRLPVVESRELFEKSTGETSDIVEKEMFVLSDAGGRSLALRPEGTPGAARAYLNHHLSQAGGPVKLFYMGSMFRAERPQAGRYREFTQIGAETFGNPHPAADAESILALRAILSAFGAGDWKLRLGTLGCDENASCRPRFREALREHLLGRASELCETCRRRLERNPLRALDCKADGPKLFAEAPRLAPCPACAAHGETTALLLSDAGCLSAYPDRSLVRGLDYYTRTVFEFQSSSLGAQDALAGGGRYDGLIASMGGPPTPAVGWALGVERVLAAASGAEAPEAPRGVFVAAQGEAAARAAAGALETLRRSGLVALGGLFASSLKAQMREANRQKARLCVIVGESELAQNPPQVRFKDMEEGREWEARLDRVAEEALARLGGRP